MKRNRKLKILLAAPRGFCAGVGRAVQIVERALEKYGAPVYVRHEIVHNKFVVDGLREKGAVFVDELDEIPEVSDSERRPVVFSAHGVAKAVPQEAHRRGMFYIDATCPLVGKVHKEAERCYKNGDQVILIGHGGHPEVIGTMGQLPEGEAFLVENISDISRIKGKLRNFDALAYCTQTTLSLDETAQIIAALKKEFPAIKSPRKEDICYATTNRQKAVKEIAAMSDVVMVLGAPNSSNSNRLVEVARQNGCERALLVQTACDIDWAGLGDINVLGLSAGASAPEVLVKEVIRSAADNFDIQVEEILITREDVIFKLPEAVK